MVSAKIDPDALRGRGCPAPENVNYAVKINRAKELLGATRGVSWKAARRAPRDSRESLTSAVHEVEAATVLVLVFRE